MDLVYEYNTKIIDAIKFLYSQPKNCEQGKNSDMEKILKMVQNSNIKILNLGLIFISPMLEEHLPRRQFFPNANVNVYSFKLIPEDHQPSCRSDLYRLDNIPLTLKLYDTEKHNFLSVK